jgi:iron complex outermembrane receptor protein
VAGAGFSVYANASYNSARLTTDQTWVPLTPNKTAALGLLYNQGPLQGSVIGKYVGRRYGDAEDAYPLGSYVTTDAAVNYLLGSFGSAVKAAKVGVTVQNLADRKSIYFLSGYSGNGSPMFFTLPGRSVQVNLSASF